MSPHDRHSARWRVRGSRGSPAARVPHRPVRATAERALVAAAYVTVTALQIPSLLFDEDPRNELVVEPRRGCRTCSTPCSTSRPWRPSSPAPCCSRDGGEPLARQAPDARPILWTEARVHGVRPRQGLRRRRHARRRPGRTAVALWPVRSVPGWAPAQAASPSRRSDRSRAPAGERRPSRATCARRSPRRSGIRRSRSDIGCRSPADSSTPRGRTMTLEAGHGPSRARRPPGRRDRARSALAETLRSFVRRAQPQVLALENQRLAAELRARIEELRTSRARLVEAGDADAGASSATSRRRAQSRLVALAMQLRLARPRRATPRVPAQLPRRGERRAAGEPQELRELARGIHPAVLTDRGLRPALEALAARTPRCPVHIEGDTPDAWRADRDRRLLRRSEPDERREYARATHATLTVAVRPIPAGSSGGHRRRSAGARRRTVSGLRGSHDRVAALDRAPRRCRCSRGRNCACKPRYRLQEPLTRRAATRRPADSRGLGSLRQCPKRALPARATRFGDRASSERRAAKKHTSGRSPIRPASSSRS
jgi:hypothetical protein